jgi:hypothetical protein
MLARVKQDYAAGPVIAFSGREYVRGEWREVPAGFEEQAKNHPLLDTQPSLEEVRRGGTMAPGLTLAPARSAGEESTPEPTTETVVAVSTETAEAPAKESPATSEPEEKPKTRRTPSKRAGAAEE